MRYHYEGNEIALGMYGETYICDHPVYDRATLYKIGDKGLCVIQQRCEGKKTYWSEIDKNLTDVIYLNRGFYDYFNRFAKEINNKDLYPTVTIRQIMWALRMKPLKREPWETYFDKAPI